MSVATIDSHTLTVTFTVATTELLAADRVAFLALVFLDSRI